MNGVERAKVLNWLEESHREFLAAIEGLTDEQWNWKPAPERWSVCDAAEHIVAAEDLLFDRVRTAIASGPDPHWERTTSGKTEFIEQVMAPRLGKAHAPEVLVPKGTATAAQLRERFEKQRAEIVDFAKSTSVALNEYTLDHPFPVFGTLNAYQWLIYLPLHTMRHDKQIEEIKAARGYPAGGRL